MSRSGVTIFQLVKQVVQGLAIYNLCLHCIGCEESRQRQGEPGQVLERVGDRGVKKGKSASISPKSSKVIQVTIPISPRR